MSVSVLFLVVSVVGLLFTLNAWRPLRFEPLAVLTFFAGWWTSELPLHHLFWQAVLTIGFVAAGALDEPAGWIGLAITIVSWFGLLLLLVQAARAEPLVEQALVDALGPDYRRRMAPSLTADHGPAARWHRLVLPFHLRDPEVQKEKNIRYAEGGRAHTLDVYRHREHRTGCPVFVYIHGGAWVIGDKREQGIPMMLHLAAQGWVCFTINYRLSPKATFPDHIIDVKRAIAWVREHAAEYGGDPSFIAVGGGSAGGHLSALAALTPNDPEYQPGFEEADTAVQAAVPLYGVYDFTNRHGLRGEGMGRFLLERYVMKAPIETHREAYEKASPMDRIDDEDPVPPFLVIHGANDSLVPVGEARAFAEMLREHSREPVAYVELPGTQHAFEVFRSVRTAHAVDAIARFLAVAYAEAGVRR